MKKFMLFFTIIVLLAAPTTVFARQITEPVSSPATITFKAPTVIPHNLDELYALIQTRGPGWGNFTDCAQKGLTGSFFRWSMVNAIEEYSIDDHGQSMLILPAADLAKIVAPGGITFPSRGTLKVSEQTLFGAVVYEVANGKVLVCQQRGDMTVYGPGAQDMFNRLVPSIE